MKEFLSKNIGRITVTLVLSAILMLSVWYFTLGKTEKQEVHYHAGFLVYNEGKLVDFSDLKYMQVIPCTVDGAEIHMDEQMEKAHLHDNIGDVVHVHTTGAVWGDLFKNINYKIDTGKLMSAFINGKPVTGILSMPIKEYDSIIISIGNTPLSDSALRKPVTKKHILDAEKRTESCGS